MNMHRNAKTTPQMRQLIATRARQGWTYARLAGALGLSVRTIAKWVARARHDALVDGSSRPHRQPRRTVAARGGDHRRTASDPCHRLADQRRAADAPVDRHAGLGAGRAQSRRARRARGSGPPL